MNKLKSAILKFLKLQEIPLTSAYVITNKSWARLCAENELWYNGDSSELVQFYQQLPNPSQSFWGAHETPGQEIRRIHTGLPREIVNCLTNITTQKFDGLSALPLIDLKAMLPQITTEMLIYGDGALKLGIDGETNNITAQWYNGASCDMNYRGGQLQSICFYTRYDYKSNHYVLVETYAKGSITYKLYKADELEGTYTDSMPRSYPLSLIPELEAQNLQDVFFDNNIILAVPVIYGTNSRFPGRGQSILQSKKDAFDALDECVSQWIDAARKSRTRVYIPQTFIGRNADDGTFLRPNSFDNSFFKTLDDISENAQNKIETVAGEFNSNNYLETYITLLDLCLQGLISPSTLGIDTKKVDNAEAQREKEKTTLYTRASIINVLYSVVNEFIEKVNLTHDIFNLNELNYYDKENLEFTFGDYASPSFESLAETLSMTNLPMSIAAKVEMLWGSTKTDEWKQEEINRLAVVI